MMVIFLVGLVSMILMRTLRKDYARYSKEDDLDDVVSGIVRVFCDQLVQDCAKSNGIVIGGHRAVYMIRVSLGFNFSQQQLISC